MTIIMIKKIVDYLTSNGHILMIIGFIVVMTSVLVYIYIQTNVHKDAMATIAFGSTVCGFVIYIIGRVFMIRKRIRAKKSNSLDPVAKDDL
jgi:hypothetical protein